MNRSLRIALVGASIVTVVAVFQPLAWGQDAKLDGLKRQLNNFSHENVVCGVYYTLVGVCLSKDLPHDTTGKQYLEGSETFFKRSIQTGQIAGVSDKALSARSQIAMDDLKSEIEDNCSNISVLLQKYAKSCKSLFEDGPARLNALVK